MTDKGLVLYMSVTLCVYHGCIAVDMLIASGIGQNPSLCQDDSLAIVALLAIQDFGSGRKPVV